MSENLSLHEDYRDNEPTEAGSDRAFGCTVGSILMAIGAAKGFIAGGITPVSASIFAPGAVLLVLGIAAPARLSTVNRLWLKVGAVIAKVVNPVILALVFYFVVTPMALVMRAAGKRPLRLVPDSTAASYWIKREEAEGGSPSMRRQF